jgi:hypothetical protein
MTDEFDTWLSDTDVERLWKVMQGELPQAAASSEEMDEFLKLVTHVAMIKTGGSGYQTATIQ